jgi:hypothetical protein
LKGGLKMFNEKEKEQLIIEAMKGSVYDKT